MVDKATSLIRLLRLVDNKGIFQPSLYLSINELRRKKAEKWWMGDKNT